MLSRIRIHKFASYHLGSGGGRLADEIMSLVRPLNFENSPRTKFANQLQTVELPKAIRKGKPNA
jgi:hypothetical protein